MPHNVLISKIRCSNPNKKSNRNRNQNYINYIATRDGVDLTPIKEEMSENELYLKYIHERPKSHGLFGNLPVAQIENISQLSSDIYKLSGETAIYRSIISLDERDAIDLGYTNKEQWKLYLNRAMPDLANAFGIPVQSLNWVSAVHMEPNHPHVHCMFWRTDGKIQNSYIHYSKQQECRELLSGIMFSAEKGREIDARTADRDSIISFGKTTMDEETEFFKNITPGIQKSIKVQKNLLTDQSILTKEMIKLFEMIPKNGALKYQYLKLNSKAKNQLDYIVKLLLDHRDIKPYVEFYEQHTDTISKTYSASKRHSKVNHDKALEDISTRIGNIVLKSAKSIILEYQRLGINIDTLFDLNDTHIDNGNMPDMDPDKISDMRSDVSLDTEYDPAKTIPYLEQSSNQENQFALYSLGKSYLDKKSDLYDPGKAISYMEQSANQGNQFALYSLGKLYLDKESDLYDIDKAVSYLEQSAKKENKFALYSLGKLYSNKELGVFDIKKAISYLEQSANQNNSFAQLKLGCIYLYGKNIESDKERGLFWINKSIEQGNEFAPTVLTTYNTFMVECFAYQSFELFSKIFSGLISDKQQMTISENDRAFRTLSRKSHKEEAKKNPHKNSEID